MKNSEQWQRLVNRYKKQGLGYDDLTREQKLELSRLQPNRLTAKQRKLKAGYDTLLGDDYGNTIRQILERKFERLAIENATDKKTGELDSHRYHASQKSKSEWLDMQYQKLDAYENFQRQFRHFNQYRPFDWALESYQSIEIALAAKRYHWGKKRPVPQFENPEPLDLDVPYYDPAPTPEYAVARSQPQTERARVALETGQAPERDFEEWERLHREWNQDMPETDERIRQSESIESVTNDVANKYKHLFGSSGMSADNFEKFKKSSPMFPDDDK